MPSSISQFLSSFNKDVARPNRFEVSIPNVIGLNSQNLNLRCETAELPSRTFTTTEQKFGSNPIEKYPYQTTYNDLTLTFIVSGDMSEKKFFDSWMELVMPSNTFNPQYKNNYTVQMKITQYDLQNNPTYEIQLNECYPIVVNQLDLDWSSDGYHKLTVMFAYTYWESLSSETSD